MNRHSSRKYTNSLILSVAALVVTLLVGKAFAEEPKIIESFVAFGVAQDQGARGTVRIAIYRWTTDAERQSFYDTLRSKGQAGLMADLQKAPEVGNIRLANTRGYALKYAKTFQLADGTRAVMIATDRPLSYGEVVQNTRSGNYDFGFVEMRFPATGKGEGKLAPANLIEINAKTGQLELENYGNLPVKLMSITSEKGK